MASEVSVSGDTAQVRLSGFYSHRRRLANLRGVAGELEIAVRVSAKRMVLNGSRSGFAAVQAHLACEPVLGLLQDDGFVPEPFRSGQVMRLKCASEFSDYRELPSGGCDPSRPGGRLFRRRRDGCDPSKPAFCCGDELRGRAALELGDCRLFGTYSVHPFTEMSKRFCQSRARPSARCRQRASRSVAGGPVRARPV
jgi:hypothetical protein